MHRLHHHTNLAAETEARARSQRDDANLRIRVGENMKSAAPCGRFFAAVRRHSLSFSRIPTGRIQVPSF